MCFVVVAIAVAAMCHNWKTNSTIELNQNGLPFPSIRSKPFAGVLYYMIIRIVIVQVLRTLHNQTITRLIEVLKSVSQKLAFWLNVSAA